MSSICQGGKAVVIALALALIAGSACEVAMTAKVSSSPVLAVPEMVTTMVKSWLLHGGISTVCPTSDVPLRMRVAQALPDSDKA